MSNLSKIAIAAVVGLLVVVGGVYALFFAGDAPEEVSLEAATEAVTSQATDPIADDESATDGDGNDADGTTSDGSNTSDEDAGDSPATETDAGTTSGAEDGDSAASEGGEDAGYQDSDDGAIAAGGDTGADVASDTGDDGDSTDQETSGASGIDGHWTIGSSAGSFAGFRLMEELTTIGSFEVVGRTPDVTGSFTIEGTSLTATTMSVDLTTLETDDSRRDGQVQLALNTREFPTATFTLTDPVDLGAGAEAGESVSVSAKGDLTINGTTQPATFSIDAQLVEGLVVMAGRTDITFDDFGVSVPSAPIVVSADNFGVVEFQLIAER